VHLADNGALDRGYIENFHVRASTRRWRARGRSPAALPRRHSRRASPSLEVATFFRMFRETERVVTLYSARRQPVGARAPTRSNAILNCHLATGRIGKPGALAVSR